MDVTEDEPEQEQDDYDDGKCGMVFTVIRDSNNYNNKQQ